MIGNISNFSIKRTITIICLLFINFLFSIKYLSRISDYAIGIALIISLFYWFLLSNRLRFNFSQRGFKYLLISVMIVFVIGASYIFIRIDVESLNVDRWSVIRSFWETVFAGEYPYLARSHMENPPGPMPFYYLLALPFYLCGELGYFSLIGLFVLCYLLSKIKGSINYKLLIIIFLMTSIFFLWEVVVRSNIFTSSILIVLFLFSYQERKNTNNLYFLAIIAGFLLSTRAVFSIPYIIFFIYSLIKKEVTVLQMSKFVIVSLIAFLTTFVPLLILFPTEFFQINPFIVQSSFFVPFHYVVFFISMAFLFPFLAKSKNELFYWSGLCLFFVILIYMIYNLRLEGLSEFYIGMKADISYFIFCVPFLLLYLVLTSELNINKTT